MSSEAILPFKPVAGQADDTEDMVSLMQTSLGFDVFGAGLGNSMIACLAQESVSSAFKSLVELPVLTHVD